MEESMSARPRASSCSDCSKNTPLIDDVGLFRTVRKHNWRTRPELAPRAPSAYRGDLTLSGSVARAACWFTRSNAPEAPSGETTSERIRQPSVRCAIRRQYIRHADDWE